MKKVRLSIDGHPVSVPEGSVVLTAIQSAGAFVPTLCHDPALKPFGACRLCIVEIEGMRGLPTSCTTPVREGMIVRTETEEIRRVRRTIVELAIANHPADCLICEKSQQCELLKVARYVGARQGTDGGLRRAKLKNGRDTSSPAFDFDPNKCILCGKCVRTCDEISGVGAIDFAHRGYQTVVTPFGGRQLAQSVCQSCGECVEHCPTGALMAKDILVPDKEVETICPYCGVGCSILVGVRSGRIVRAKGNEKSPVNRGELCVKGRFGLDFVNHRDRLTRPLIRREDVPKGASGDITVLFREADWDEALERVARGMANVIESSGPEAAAVLSSAKCTNEENYVIQKFARAALGTNNVDHCARLCHASTVAAALAAFGDGAMSNSISDVDEADVLFVIGSNTTECHPIIGRRIKRAVKNNGAKLIVADPRAIELSESAEVYLSHFPGTDIALLNGMMNLIVEEGLYDTDFVANRCEGFEPFLESIGRYDPTTVEMITGVPADKIRQSARIFGRAKRAIILYGMGITQHTTGSDNVKAVANLLMLTGNLGRKGTGFAPLRGQNNVQGACDMGALPVFFPGYQRVDNPAVKEGFERAWGKSLSAKPGFTVTEMVRAAHDGQLKALYVIGENPLLSEPDIDHAKEALSRLETLVVQDIFLTETAQLADVVLPAGSFAEKDGTFTSTERRVQRVRKAMDPPGAAKADWEIVAALSARLGYIMSYRSSAEIMTEIAKVTPIYGGISHARLEKGSIQWPCWDFRHPGSPMLHKDQFSRGRGRFHVVHDGPPAELPTSAYPIMLTTGRMLEHFHTGSMSHRSRVLETLVPESHVEINPFDANRLGIAEGDSISLTSRRGRVNTKAKKTDRVREGQAFMAFHWGEAPANRLTNPVLDPLAKIPEFKVSSVKAILTVLERAAEDNLFLAALSDNPAGALALFDLTPEHRDALVNGDIESIEKWVGPLDERLQAWLKERLTQENFSRALTEETGL
ncbi:MAG: formate dehydrogenase subunit alpha [Syntrophorhabdales bacterium]